MKSFITSQFAYCPLIWMFHSRPLNNKIKSINEKSLRITYQDHISTFQELLNKNNSISIYHRNLEVLVTEMFKIHRGLSPGILREIFVLKINLYNLRRNNIFLKDVKFTTFTTALNRYPFQVQKLGIQCHWNLNNWKPLKSSKWKQRNGFPLNVLADCVELIHNKLGFFKSERLTIIIDCYYHCYYHIIIYVVYTIIYTSKLVKF